MIIIIFLYLLYQQFHWNMIQNKLANNLSVSVAAVWSLSQCCRFHSSQDAIFDAHERGSVLSKLNAVVRIKGHSLT